MPASSKTIVRGWGAVLGLEDVRKAYDARRRASFRGRLLSVVSVALVVSGLVVVSVPVMLQSWSVFCQVVIGQCGVSFPSEKAVGFSPVRNWPVIARVLLFHCIRA